jgi:hypothetical protein
MVSVTALSELKRQRLTVAAAATTNPEFAPIAEYLANGRIRVFGLPVPKTLSPNRRCRISTTFFVRCLALSPHDAVFPKLDVVLRRLLGFPLRFRKAAGSACAS